mmetsp:Transcript_33837/g.86483  ORF Transcript_33837/g.86483 Transcript_33837/m.86483 type:complete len:244 (+) Transcript_33837:262-993(+)
MKCPDERQGCGRICNSSPYMLPPVLSPRSARANRSASLTEECTRARTKLSPPIRETPAHQPMLSESKSSSAIRVRRNSSFKRPATRAQYHGCSHGGQRSVLKTSSACLYSGKRPLYSSNMARRAPKYSWCRRSTSSSVTASLQAGVWRMESPTTKATGCLLGSGVYQRPTIRKGMGNPKRRYVHCCSRGQLSRLRNECSSPNTSTGTRAAPCCSARRMKPRWRTLITISLRSACIRCASTSSA